MAKYDDYHYNIAGWYDEGGIHHEDSKVDWGSAHMTVVHFTNDDTGLDRHLTLVGPWDDLGDWTEWIQDWIDDSEDYLG